MKCSVLFAVLLVVHELGGLPVDRHEDGAAVADRGNEKKRRSVKTVAAEEEEIFDTILRINKDADVIMYEGDIDLSLADVSVDATTTGNGAGQLNQPRSKRNAARDRKRLWNTKVVPYQFDSGLSLYHRPTIMSAIAEFQNKTCLKFVPRTTEDNWIIFVKKKGCWSAVGQKYWKKGVPQEISLDNGCNTKGTVIHEIMHAIGFWHEQSRPDRNEYVEVMWENIEPGEEYNFNKYSHGDIDRLQVPYDYESIMHYGKKSFSKNGQPTIRSIRDPNREMGQRRGFTDFDLREINSLYDCANTASVWSSWSNFGPCSIGCEKFRQRFCTSNNYQQHCPKADEYGVQTQFVKCSKEECFAPVDGHWGRWSSWGTCDQTCGFGAHTRKRQCHDPPPKNGGADCPGEKIEHGRCKLKSCGLGPYDCEFDEDKMCHWTNDPTNSKGFNWIRSTGSTPSGSTGPSADHTSGSGHYLYIEASSPALPGSKARLLSRKFPATDTGRCLTFWYHMYGSSIGALNVYIKHSSTDSLEKIWFQSGNKGDQWLLGKVTVTSSDQYQIAIEGVRGPSFRGDIGLDDIHFEERPCILAVGCYRDKVSSRAIPVMIGNFRGQIDWYHMEKTVAMCARAAQQRHYKTFAIQFYGECYSGPEESIFPEKHGKQYPPGCWQGVGGPNMNYVYKIV